MRKIHFNGMTIRVPGSGSKEVDASSLVFTRQLIDDPGAPERVNLLDRCIPAGKREETDAEFRKRIKKSLERDDG